MIGRDLPCIPVVASAVAATKVVITASKGTAANDIELTLTGEGVARLISTAEESTYYQLLESKKREQ